MKTETRKVKDTLSFHLNFFLMMISVGRNDEASRSIENLSNLIDSLPEDLTHEFEIKEKEIA